MLLTRKYIYALLPGNSPHFLIIGAQKCGTTSMHYYLNQHPRLVGSNPKELHYFDNLINYGNNIKWYEAHFKSISLGQKLYFESSPSYIYYEEVAKQLSKYKPDIKLILILRNPVERAFSAWRFYQDIFDKKAFYLVNTGRKPNEDGLIYNYLMQNGNRYLNFNEAINIELEIIAKGRLSEPAILRRGLYYRQIESYLKYFGKEQLYIVDFMDLVERTESTLLCIYNFLGVPDYSFNKLKLEPRNVTKYKASLSENDREFLNEFYAIENRKLYAFLGKNLNW